MLNRFDGFRNSFLFESFTPLARDLANSVVRVCQCAGTEQAHRFPFRLTAYLAGPATRNHADTPPHTPQPIHHHSSSTFLSTIQQKVRR